MRIGVAIDAVVDVNHPLVNLIKEISSSGRAEVIFIFQNELSESIFGALNIRTQKIQYNENSEIQNLDLDIYISTNNDLNYQIQKKGTLAGFLNLDSMECQVSFDHRLFMDETTYKVMGSWLCLLGFLQKHAQINVKVSVITTNHYSVESWIKDLFKSSNCRIDSVCFLATGGKNEILKFFGPCIYFEGQKRESVIPRNYENPLLFV